MKTKLKVLGHRVLVKPYDPTEQFNKDVPEDLKKVGFEIALGSKDTERRWFEASQEGLVVQVGPMAWKSQSLGFGLPGWAPWVQAGDKIKFVQYSKDIVVDPSDGTKYFVINDVDVLTKIED